MTREEAIKKANDKLDSITYLSECSANPGLRKVYGNMADWLSKVVYLAEIGLKTQQEAEKNEPLTLDDLREMDGDKIYIQFIGACKGFYDNEYAPYYGKQEQYIQEYNGMLRACDLPLKYYGDTWLAYRRKPEEE